MKFNTSFLAFALLLLLGAGLAGAAPSLAFEAAADEASLAPADLFNVSVLSADKDCAAADVAEAQGLDPFTCGGCSTTYLCRGQEVGAVCAFNAGTGKFLFCQDWLGQICPQDGGARCRCSSEPNP